MRQGLVWLGRVLVALVLLAAVLFAGSRWLGRDSAELRLLEQASPTPGRNAFAALWLMPYDIPPDEIEAIAAEDVRRFAARDAGDTSEFVSIAEGRYPRTTDSVDGSPEWCDQQGKGCLAHVRANRDALRSAVSERQPLLERMRALSGVGHHLDQFQGRNSMLPWIPPSLPTRELLTAQALAYADGDATGALEAVCDNVATWRPLAARSDSLMITMTAIRMVERSSRLLADMLTEQPDGQPVPATCRAAYAPPVPEEYLPCAAMRGEFRLTDATAKTMEEAKSGPLGWLVYDHRMTSVRTASYMGQACTGDARQAALRGEPVASPADGEVVTPMCASNLVGCLITGSSAPAYTDYLHRTQDHAARLQAMDLLLRLHENTDDRSHGERLATMPADSIPAGRKIEVVDVDGGEALRLELFWQGRGRYWEVPLTAPVDPAVSPPPTGGGA